MKSVSTEDPPLCPECRKNRVKVDEFVPFAAILGGRDEKRARVFPYCDACMRAKFTQEGEEARQRAIDARIRKAKADSEVPWFQSHDPRLMNKETLAACGEACFERRKDQLVLRDRGVWVWGKTGTGKSRALSRLTERVYALGYTVRWVSFSDALWGHREAVMNDDDTAARRKLVAGMCAAHVLVIDDFGSKKARLTQSGYNYFWDLLDWRYQKAGMGGLGLRVLWVTSQDPPEKAIADSLDRDMKGVDIMPMVRRITEMTTVVEAV